MTIFVLYQMFCLLYCIVFFLELVYCIVESSRNGNPK